MLYIFRLNKNLLIKIQTKGAKRFIVLELCESRSDRPGLSDLTSLKVSVDVKQY